MSTTKDITYEDREAISAWADEFATISQRTAAAWDSRDPVAMRALYTEDITHDDDRFSVHIQGIDAVMAMGEAMFAYQTPDVRFRASPEFGAGFIGGEGGVMVWEAWEVFGYTDEDPLVEVDRLGLRDGRIASWTLHYETPPPNEEIMAYATAWASGDPDQVVALYDAAAIRDDSIAGTRTEGSEAVRTTATDFFVAHSDATWELLVPFGAGTTSGGIFAIGDADGCSVRAAVVLHIKSGKIVQEEVYYDGASLLAGCWFS